MISQYAKLVEKLTRGFIKFTGRQPDNLEKLKIRQEAANRIKEESKVIEFPKEKITPFYKERPMPKESKSEGVGSLFKKKPTSVMVYDKNHKPGMAGMEVELKNKSKAKTFKEQLEEKTGMKLTGKETFGELMEKLGKGKKEGIEQIDIDDIDDFDPSGMAAGGLITKGVSRLIKELSKIKNKSKTLTDDQILDLEVELGDSEGWLSEGTVKEALEAAKRRKDEIEYYYGQYRTGKLDPQPGEVNRSRLEFLKRKVEEAEMSGDRRLITKDEIDELNSLEQRFEYLDLEDKAQNLARGMKDEEIKKLKEINDSGYVDFQKEMDRVTKNVAKKMNENKKANGGRVGLQTGGFMYPAEPFPYYNLEDLQIFTRAGIPESEAEEIYKRAGYVFDPTKRSLGITSSSPTTTSTSTSTTPAVTTPNVVAPTTVVPTAQTIQTGGGDDRRTGFGRFGNLDPTTEKTFNVEVYDEEVGDFVPTTLTGYQNVNSGLYQTKEGKNINPMFSNTGITPGIIGAAVNLLGLDQDTVGGYVPGSIRGKYDGIGDFFTQTKEFLSRKENLKQDAFQKAEAEKAAQEKIKKAEEAKKIAEAAEKIRIKREKYGTTDYGQGAGGQSYSNMGTQGFGVAAGGMGGPVSNKTGKGRQDYKKGGLATMFKLKG